VTYTGHKLTQDATKPDDMPAPTDKKGVERLLVTVNFLGKFIPNLASVTEPIRVLLRKDILDIILFHMSKTMPFKKLRLS